ncbi:class I SAM-dependent methyltransferase [Phenylobacterium ferrooxidans]|uniref:Class I SAM-dependent methyltransferase n=1 Tax=Phenylobacterium ferrooxidans TaxID=2982689 RepID=A0ABW6CUC3_9CAUL
MTAETRDAFDATSKFYDRRLPYDTRLFQQLAIELALGPEVSLLDICCGNGQLSVGFADRVKEVVGIDFSEGMLKRAPQRPNIRYLRHDLNAPALPGAVADHRFHHFVVGRAIHWLTPESLVALIGSNLRPGGSVVNCGAGWSDDTPWLEQYVALRKSYRPGQARGGRGNAGLGMAGFAQQGGVRVNKTIWCDLELLVKHALSYSSLGDMAPDEVEYFREDLTKLMEPYRADGLYQGNAVTWGAIYRRNEQLA